MTKDVGEQRQAGNPVIPNVQAADPHITLAGDRYYIYATEAAKTEPGFAAWSSQDLQTWQPEGMVYRFAESRWARGRDWAPCVEERNGRYYFYFSADDRIGVAVGDSPTGPFRDPLGAPLCPYKDDISVIDPMAFIDDDGEAYLYWGAVPAAWLVGKATFITTTLSVRKLRRDMCSFDGPELPTIETPMQPDGSYGPHIEASHMLKRNGIYYLMYSLGSWDRPDDEHAYRVMYATATHPLGPWTIYPYPVLSTRREIDAIGPGHHSVIQLPGTEEYFIAYHAHRGDADRRIYIDQLTFGADGTIETVVPTRAGPPPRPIRLGLRLERMGPFEQGAAIGYTILSHDPFTRLELMVGDQVVAAGDGKSVRLVWKDVPAGFHRVRVRGTLASSELVYSSALNIDVL